jgi:uncharacterized protein (TIGR03084 family)
VNDRLAQVLADLGAEGDQLEALVATLDEAGWRTPTAAKGWDVAHQIAHLAWTDEAAAAAATDKHAWDAVVLEAMADPDGFVDTEAAAGAQAETPALLARWHDARTSLVRTLTAFPVGQKMPWFGPPMSATSMATARLMETWAHGRDVAGALGVTFEADDRVRHVAYLGVRTRDFAFATNGIEAPAEEFRVELLLPSGETATFGPSDAAQSLRGSAYDFALLVTQRANRDDLDLTATGEDVDQWLDIAQAFAGPPGTGRGSNE